MCYGLRTDFQGKLFSGSHALLAIADELREVRTICRCGSKATMVVRLGPDGKVARQGEQVAIGKDVYVSLCRRHWEEEMGRVAARGFHRVYQGLTARRPAFSSGEATGRNAPLPEIFRCSAEFQGDAGDGCDHCWLARKVQCEGKVPYAAINGFRSYSRGTQFDFRSLFLPSFIR